jgi:hypothetical protein
MPRTYSITTPEGRELAVDWWEDREPNEKDLEAIYAQFQTQFSQTPKGPTESEMRAQAIKEHPQSIAGIPVQEARGEFPIDPTSAFSWGMGGVTLPAVGLWAKLRGGLAAKGIEKLRPLNKVAQPGTIGKTAEVVRIGGQEVTKSGLAPVTKTVSEIYREAEAPLVTSIKATEKQVAQEMNQPGVLGEIQKIIDEKRGLLEAEGRTLPGVQRPTSITQPSMTESEKFKAPLLKPKPSSNLEKLDFDLLKDESGAIQLDLIQSPLEKTRAAIKDAFEFAQSPYYVMAKDPSGRGDMIYRRLEEADRAKAIFLKRMREERLGKIHLSPDTPESEVVGQLLDEYATSEEIPAYKWGTLSQSQKDAFKFYRQKWNEAGDLLEKKGFIGGEGKPRRIKEYLFRIFDKETVYNAAKNEYNFVTSELSSGGLDAKQTAILKERYSKLKNIIDTYERTGTILYDYIPKEIQVPFLKPRAGAKGYSTDVVRAYDIYEQFLAKKLFDEPALKESLELFKDMPLEHREYTRNFLRRFAGLERENKFNNLARVATAFEYYKDMGFNVRSAMVNATQSLNTIVDIGPRWTAEGAYRAMFDPEAKALWRASGHSTDVPSLRYGLVSRTAEAFGKYPWYLFDKVELGNRATAYIGGYYKALSEGNSPALAKLAGDNTVRRTQFIYGRTGSPMALHAPGGPLYMQFSTFTIKQLEFLTTLAREDKKKFIAYLLIANGLNEASKEIGVDFSNALGIGVDFRELWSGFKDMSKGDMTAAWIHTKLGLPHIPGTNIGTAGSGIFPQGVVPVVETLSSAIKGEWEKLLPTQYQRTHQSVQALVEGEMFTVYPGEEFKAEKGYPVTNIRTGYLKSLESPLQLTSRVFGPRPYKEAKEFHELAREQMMEETRKSLAEEALISYGKGNTKEFNRLMNKYNLAFNEDDFTRLYLNRMTTPIMRKRVQELKSQKDILFKKSIGEPVLPNMP